MATREGVFRNSSEALLNSLSTLRHYNLALVATLIIKYNINIIVALALLKLIYLLIIIYLLSLSLLLSIALFFKLILELILKLITFD